MTVTHSPSLSQKLSYILDGKLESFLKNSKLREIESLTFYRWNRHVLLSHAAADTAFVNSSWLAEKTQHSGGI